MKKTRLFLLAIISGIITTGIFYVYSTQAQTASTTTEVEPVEMVDIVVSISDIMTDQEITEEMISVKQIEKDRVHAKAITKLEDVLGKYATTDISIDEPILEHRVRDMEDETKILSRKIAEDKVGVSIEVKEYWESVTNLVVPEDYVDVIWTREEKGKLKTDIILEKKRVLAVGENIKENEPKGIESPVYTTVTLELTHEEAIKVVDAQNKGHILHLALHSRLNAQEKSE